VVTGAVLYPAFVLLLWRLSGSPETAEQQLLAWLGERLRPALTGGKVSRVRP